MVLQRKDVILFETFYIAVTECVVVNNTGGLDQSEYKEYHSRIHFEDDTLLLNG